MPHLVQCSDQTKDVIVSTQYLQEDPCDAHDVNDGAQLSHLGLLMFAALLFARKQPQEASHPKLQ
jgi:hypothetical protein